MTAHVKAKLVKTLARETGFDLAGVAPAGESKTVAYYRKWLDAGYAGSMAYLHRHARLREDVRSLLPGARSVICVGVSYHRSPVDVQTQRAPLGRIAAYARGRDYHTVLRGMLNTLADRLRRRLEEPFDCRPCVDTAPVLEREWAARAGLGWIGKNTCLLNRRLGSDVFLGSLLTTLDLAADGPVAEHCARCTRCIDACPTGALLEPRRMDARRCISYLTIEHRGGVAEAYHAAMGPWVYGCDICQEVCPYNRRAPAGTQPEIMQNRLPETVNLLDLLALRSGSYRRLTSESAASRARRNMWRRNAAIALGNAHTQDAALEAEIRQRLQEASRDEDPTVAAAARAALQRRARRPGED